MHILIAKHGALGDVVRTSYFAHALREKWGKSLRLSWVTAVAAEPLLRFNPAINDLWTSFNDADPFRFDQVFSLDDELEVLSRVARLKATAITGALLNKNGKPAYTDDTAEWFDMGLLSRYGKEHADALKKRNRRTHGEMFSQIFDVNYPSPRFYGDAQLESDAQLWLGNALWYLGINSFAGGRWPSKELALHELKSLLTRLLALADNSSSPMAIILLGAGSDQDRNHAIARTIGDNRIRVAETKQSPLHLAAIVRGLNYIITSDSLAMHLAASQGVPFLAFFSPTSASEIDDFGMGRKLISTANDYCSYRKDADNSTITAERILEIFRRHASVPRLLERTYES